MILGGPATMPEQLRELAPCLPGAASGASKMRIRRSGSPASGEGEKMRTVPSATILLAATVVAGLAQDSVHSESLHLAFECRAVAESAETYLSEHGVFTTEKTRFQDISIVGREFEPITAGSLAHRRKRKPWTDAHGSEVTDLKVYWTYANRATGEKLPFGIWRLRTAHCQPEGDIKLTSDGGGCKVDFQLTFDTWGANVIGILPLDSQWSYYSNGRLEREYLDGISATLEQQKSAPPTHPSS